MSAKRKGKAMPNINDAFPSNYLKASDIRGSEPVVTIDRVEYEPVGRQREMKAVVYFKGKEKGVVLNKTNATKIVQLAGSALTEDWDGCRIRLFATETEFGGETVECIRIKAAPSNRARTAAPPKTPPPPKPVAVSSEDHVEPLTDDDIPF
jgi:hypothetical protein